METLGYTQEWLTFGIIDERGIQVQLANFRAAGGGAEHCRYGAFLRWIKSRTTVSNDDIRNFIDLAVEDDDPSMGGAAIVQLFNAQFITDQQFDFIVKRIRELQTEGKIGAWITKNITRTTLVRALESRDLDEELFGRCLRGGDGWVHEVLLDRKDITRDQMLKLSQFGHTRRIRNIAKQYSASKKRWQS